MFEKLNMKMIYFFTSQVCTANTPHCKLQMLKVIDMQ